MFRYLIPVASPTYLLLFIGVCIPSLAVGTDFQQRTYTSPEGKSFAYTVSFPDDYKANTDQNYPVILFLHGAGERGTDGIRPSQVGLGAVLRQPSVDYPAVVVYPQCSNTDSRLISGWLAEGDDAQRALTILDDVIANERIDADRQILVGWSMGGYGAWSLGAATADRWSAIVPLAGGGDPELVQQLKSVPVWAFHGQRDLVIPVSQTQQLTDALSEAGGNVKLTVVAEAGHDIWRYVFDKPVFQNWLFASDKSQLAESNAAQADAFSMPMPNVPSTGTIDYYAKGTVNNLMTINLSNEMVARLLAPEISRLTSQPLSGTIANISLSQSVEGHPFTATFGSISYNGQIAGAHMRAIGNDLVQIDLQVQSIQLRIGGTYVRGTGLRQAQTGPTTISIGHRYPLTLSITARLDSGSGQLRLTQVGSQFSIPSNNYSVSRPSVYVARGIGVTADRVASGIVQGLYGSRSRIESEVRQVVPAILSQVQSSLNNSLNSHSTEMISLEDYWPLPTYAPRLQPVPGPLHCTANGFSLSLNATVFTTSPQAATTRHSNQRIQASVTTKAPVSLAVSLSALSDLTQLADLQGAMIDLRDIPGEPLKSLSDPQTLKQLAEQPNSSDEFRGLLMLASGIELKQSAGTVEAIFPQVQFRVESRGPDQSVWRPQQTSSMSVKQPFTLKLTGAESGNPTITLLPAGSAQVTILRSPNPPSGDLLASNFQKGWNDWLKGRGALEASIPDLQISGTTLRANELIPSGTQIALGYNVPPTTLVNLAEERFEFQLRNSTQGWGEPISLAKGETHTFASSTPTGYRLKGQTQIKYLLPVGFQGEYRPSASNGTVALYQAKATQGRSTIVIP